MGGGGFITLSPDILPVTFSYHVDNIMVNLDWYIFHKTNKRTHRYTHIVRPRPTHQARSQNFERGFY